MRVSPFNAMHAAVDPCGVLIRDFLATAGEEHGRNMQRIALRTVSLIDDDTIAAVAEIVWSEYRRMAAVYREAGVTRRQSKAYLDGFFRGVHIAIAEAKAVYEMSAQGSA